MVPSLLRVQLFLWPSNACVRPSNGADDRHLKGTAIRKDKDRNEEFYGQPYETREIVLDGRVAHHLTDAVGHWRSALNRYAQ